ncbi:UDP-galactopyranose mutase [Brachyspira sp.]|uniref:UDP-galactopyranose mutase n=1 Tax=Brachyspira sp. TaxID=1977261 RepID=UPI00345B5F6C
MEKNEIYYTVNNKKSNELYQKYINKSKYIDNLNFLGRLGDYKYYNIDSAVNRSILLFKELLYK